MSAHHRTLTDAIDAARREVRQQEDAGHPTEAALASERLAGMLLAEQIMFGADTACPHVQHRFVGTNGKGVNVWSCRVCEQVYPAGAELPVAS